MMMNEVVSIKKFNFFESTVLSRTTPGIAELTQNELITATGGGGYVYFGDAHGNVTIASSSFDPIAILHAHASHVSYIKFLPSERVLITIGDGKDVRTMSQTEMSREAARTAALAAKTANVPIKIRSNLDDDDNNNIPHHRLLCATAKFWKISNNTKLTFELLNVVKLVEESILCFDVCLSSLILGLEDGRVMMWRDPITRRSPKEISIRKKSSSRVTAVKFASRDNIIFVITSKSVETYNIDTQKQVKMLNDSSGATKVGCATFCESQIAVAQNESAVYFYTNELKGKCFAFQNRIEHVRWVQNRYLLVESVNERGIHQIDIQDLEHRLVVSHFPLRHKSNLLFVLEEWGRIFLVTSNHEIVELKEKTMERKLGLLFNLGLFDVALSLGSYRGSNNRTDKSVTLDTSVITKMYADHLFEKQDYDASIKKYILTTSVEPSYVISRFMTRHRFDNIAQYLEAMHSSKTTREKIPRSDHTELLLECYYRLNDNNKRLEEFLFNQDSNFDVNVVVSSLRVNDRIETALRLASQRERHDLELLILIEDREEYESATKRVLKIRPIEEALRQAQTFASKLLRYIPESTTDMLIELLTTSTNIDIGPHDFISCFDAAAVTATSKSQSRRHLLRFLRAFVTSSPRNKYKNNNNKMIWNRMLEMLLQEWSEAPLRSEPRAALDKSVCALLEHPRAEFDETIAMILMQTYEYESGLNRLLEKNNMYASRLGEILVRAGTEEESVQFCELHGEHEPQLWVQLLSHVAKNNRTNISHIREILRHISESRVLTPIEILDILGESPCVTLEAILPYVKSMIEYDDEKKHAQQLVERHKTRTKELHEMIQKQQDTERFDFQSTTCRYCKTPLHLPLVQFFSGHTYHARCFKKKMKKDTSETSHDKIIQALRRKSKDYSAFVESLDCGDEEEGRYDKMMGYFGVGIQLMGDGE